MESNLQEDTMEYIDYPEYADIMELFIETLTGTVFELRVSPFETVISVKAKIQRLEGAKLLTGISGKYIENLWGIMGGNIWIFFCVTTSLILKSTNIRC